MIKHIKCDIFESGADVILHQVNCQGEMNSGIAKQVKEKYPEVYNAYKKLCDEHKDNPSEMLGSILGITTEIGYIVNIFAQENFGYDGKCYTDYDALKMCLLMLVSCTPPFGTVAIPYLMGCYRGGGDWNTVYQIIKDVFKNESCDVLICEYNGG